MPYVQSWTSLRLHHKTSRLRKLLGDGISRPAVVGHLHLLWHWVLEYRPEGDVSGLSAAELAEAAEWTGDPTLWLEALATAGFLDRLEDAQGAQLTLHDWRRYAGEMLRKREARAQLKAAAEQQARQTAHRALNTTHRKGQP